MKFIFLFIFISCSMAQVNYVPSGVFGFRQARPIDDYVLAPYDIIFDSTKGAAMPKMYRSPVFFKHSPHQKFDMTGFNGLTISGSAQYSWPELKEVIAHIHKRHKVSYDKIYIFDLREESHAFINDAAVSWFSGPLDVQQNRTSQDAIESELKHVNQVRAFPIAFIYKVVKSPVGMPESKEVGIYPINVVMREQEAVKSLGANYIRLPVTDHYRPQESDVDDFVEIVRKLPADAWLHFKCRGGKGRTTTFMTLFDIIQNPTVALEEILTRQKALGGTDLMAKKAKPGHEWKQRLADDRVRIIEVFYDYRHAKDGWNQMKFSDWVRKHARYLGYLGDRFDLE